MKAEQLARKIRFKKTANLPEDVFQKTDKALSGDLLDLRDLLESPQKETGEKHSPGAAILGWCAEWILEIPTGRELLKDASARGWKIGFSSLKDGGYALEGEDRHILLDWHEVRPDAIEHSGYFRNITLLTFLRALRDAWHETRLDPLGMTYGPEGSLALERARAADGETLTVLCAWELRGAGYPEAWRHLIGSEDGDMAMVFHRFTETGGVGFPDETALSMTFRQWYADEVRTNACDHDSLERLDDLLGEEKDSLRLENIFPSSRVFENLVRLPCGRSYLSGKGNVLIEDSFFAGLKDPVNAAHLRHLLHDLQSVRVGGVSFQDPRLARQIFPEHDFREDGLRTA